MVRIKGKNNIPAHANEANKAPLKDSYRPAGHDSRAEPQDENWQPSHADSRTHARGDSYRPEYRSSSLETADSYRPGHGFYHSYRPEQDLYNTQLHDSYRPEQHSRSGYQGDTYRPNYDAEEQITSPQSKPSFSFGEPAPPPPSPAIAAIDVEMDDLLVTTSMLTVANEQSSRSVMEVTRELLLRGLPLELAGLYASEKNRFIPVHKIPRSCHQKILHSVHCKKCGQLQPIALSKKATRGPQSHPCGRTAAIDLTVAGADEWRRVLEHLEDRGWKLGPGPHDEADSELYLGSKLVVTIPNFTLGLKKKKRAKLIEEDMTPAMREKAAEKKAEKRAEKRAEKKAIRATLNTQLGGNLKLSKKEPTQARARARDIVRGQSEKQETNDFMAQQALPAFDIRDLGTQLNSLSLATTDVQPSKLT
ncbi:hypothetical protein EG328_009149 [Venturia inaequalis]|nr:hypothetical protein EG328_009149 [Venturia inaequalis]